MRVYWRDSRPMVDWGHLGERRFTEPFFAQTSDRCVRHPADLLFRHQTSMEELGEIAGLQADVQPTGLIFHLSRCGSTLVSQMLASSPENIVLSEAPPLDGILRSHFRNPAITEAQRLKWLQWLVRILAWRRHPAEKNVFIKFDSWHVLFLPLIQRAFPAVPWIFLYRDPMEVIASHVNQRGAQMIPGVLEPAIFGWDQETVGRMTLDEYGVRVLAAICEAALEQVRGGHGKLVNYSQLPVSIWPALLADWNVKFSPNDMARMFDVAQLDAKNPALPFAADSRPRRSPVSPAMSELTQKWLAPVYKQLEAQRQAGGFA